MKVGIGNDHAAVELKMQIKEFIESMGHEVVNYGVDTAESCNYPEIGDAGVFAGAGIPPAHPGSCLY